MHIQRQSTGDLATSLFFALLIPVRIAEWCLLIHLFFDKGLVEITRSRAEPVFTPDGGLVLRLSARLNIGGARLFRVGYQVIVVIAP